MTTFRPRATAALGMLTLAAGVGLAAPASAAPVAVDSAPHVAQLYSDAPVATVDRSVVTPGQPGTVSITGAAPSSTFTATILGTSTSCVITTDATGAGPCALDTTGLAPASYTIQVLGEGFSRSFALTVSARQGTVVPAGTNAAGTRGGLAFTGATAVVPLAALGGVLLVGGAGAVVLGRRRRDDSG